MDIIKWQLSYKFRTVDDDACACFNIELDRMRISSSCIFVQIFQCQRGRTLTSSKRFTRKNYVHRFPSIGGSFHEKRDIFRTISKKSGTKFCTCQT